MEAECGFRGEETGVLGPMGKEKTAAAWRKECTETDE